MNEVTLKQVLQFFEIPFEEFQKYMVGKTQQYNFVYLSDIEYFLYLRIKDKLNL